MEKGVSGEDGGASEIFEAWHWWGRGRVIYSNVPLSRMTCHKDPQAWQLFPVSRPDANMLIPLRWPFHWHVADSCQAHAKLRPFTPLMTTGTATITRTRAVVAVCLLPTATQSRPNDLKICCPHRGEGAPIARRAPTAMRCSYIRDDCKYLLQVSKCNL